MRDEGLGLYACDGCENCCYIDHNGGAHEYEPAYCECMTWV